MQRRAQAMPKALAMLALGHFLAMIGILLPFSLMIFLVQWETEIRIGAGVLVIAPVRAPSSSTGFIFNTTVPNK